MNNPYLLKKQLQENEDELSNYLRDMNIWKEQMKRKEHSPTSPNENKKSKTNCSSKPEAKKISSWDYSAWDKFDVDKACEDLDTPNDLKKNTSNVASNNATPTNQSEGLYEKNLGNALVQKQKWAEAILRYTRAMDYYDKDPIFYANRALCYLKTNDYKLAIQDCTTSLKLDSTYVKSYQRRSASYIALGMYDEAIKDLNKILKLEPNNKQAKLDIEVVNNKIKQDTIQKNANIKLPKKTNTINNSKNTGSNILKQDDEKPTKHDLPQWPLRLDCKQVTSKQKPPHLRSKKPLWTPKISDVQVDQDKLNLLQTTLKEVCGENTIDIKFKNKDTIIKKESVKKEVEHCLVIPPPPQTYVRLKQDWVYLKNSSKHLFQYMMQIPGKHLPLIVHKSMENDLFVDMLNILKSEFIPNGHDITDYLIGISELPRLQMLVMFCSDTELSCIKELLNHVSKSVPEDVFKSLKNSFGV